MRAVLDPNVIISAALSRSGTPARVFQIWIEGSYEVVCSAKLLDELKRAFDYPRIVSRVHPDEADELITLLRTEASGRSDPRALPTVTSVDPHDDSLIALAESTRSVLVTGDRDLLDLAGQIPVYSPRNFLSLLGERGG